MNGNNMKNRTLLSVFAAVILIGPAVSSVYAEPEEKDSVQYLSIDVKNTDIRDVIRMISKGYDINIILDKDVSGSVTLHLNNVPVMEGLRTLAESHGWEVVKKGSIYKIKMPEEQTTSKVIYRNGKLTVEAQNLEVTDFIEELSRKTSASIVTDSDIEGKLSGKLYKVPLEHGLRAILESNGFKIEQRKNIYRVTYGEESASSGSGRRKSGRGSSRGRDFYVDFSDGKLTLDVMNGEISDVIEEISKQSEMEIVIYGRISGEVNAVLNDIPLSRGLELLLSGTKFTYVEREGVVLIGDRNTATPSGQALSKSELVHLKHIKADEIPKILPKNIPAGNIKVIKEQNGLLVSGTSEDISKTRDFLATIDIPTPQVLMDVVVVEYTRELNQEFGLEAGIKSKDVPTGVSFPYIDAQGSGSTVADALKTVGFSNTLIGNISDNFYAVLRFLEKQNKANILARPSLTVLNGNKAKIDVSQTSYFEIQGGTTDNPTVNFRPINYGIKLDITPWISKSGQITVDVRPDISNAMGVNDQGYPNVFKRSISTSVRLDNKETLVLGGLLREDESVSHKQVPILSKIPILGYLFKTTVKNKIKTNLVIYITPKIIEKDDYVNLQSEVDKMNIDTRSRVFSKFNEEPGERPEGYGEGGILDLEPESEEEVPDSLSDTQPDTLKAEEDTDKDMETERTDESESSSGDDAGQNSEQNTE